MMTIMCSAVYDSHDENMGLRNHKYATLYGSLPYTFIEWVVGGWAPMLAYFTIRPRQSWTMDIIPNEIGSVFLSDPPVPG